MSTHPTHPLQFSNQSPQQYVSSLPELSLPEGGFKSNIPSHLLAGTDKQTEWIMNEISKNTAATEFACQAAVTQNAHLRVLNGRTYKNEKAAQELREELDTLNEQAASVSPFLKPVGQFASLWQYAAFRWTIYIALAFIITYVYPAYIALHPDLAGILLKLLGISS